MVEGGLPLYQKAVWTRPIVSTVGAGDALFAAFIHAHVNGHPPAKALQMACTFASYKIGEAGSASGFLSAAELEQASISLN